MIRFRSEGSLDLSVIYGWASADLFRFTSSRAAEPRPGSNTRTDGPCVGSADEPFRLDKFKFVSLGSKDKLLLVCRHRRT